MYNIAYIREYTEQQYIEALKNPSILESLKNDYLNQYNDKSDAAKLAFKESLDHYVRMMIEKKPELLNTTAFQNYVNYILEVAEAKRYKTPNDHYINPELVTNPVLNDDNIRKKIFDMYLKSDKRSRFERYQMFSSEYIKLIFNAIIEGKRLSQTHINIAADYIYTSRDLDNKYGEIFAKYILNNSKKYGITSTSAINGAMTTIVTNNYSLDDEVKNTRFYIAEYDGGEKVPTAHSNGSKRYCVFQKTVIDEISLTNADSLFMSRTNKSKDIYWILMVSNHELTHQHQKLDVARQKLSSSGLGYIINNILKDYMPKGIYNGKVITDYKVNHDSAEMEMEADEEGWRQTRKFIHKHVDRENRTIIDENGKENDMWFIAKNNEEIIQIRRAFSLKKDVQTAIKEKDLPPEKKTKGMYYAHYDILNLTHIMKKHPELSEKYPTLKNLFYQNGEIRALDILKLDIYKNSQEDSISMNNRNNTGREIGTFVLNHKWNSVIREIESGKLKSKDEIKQISNNLYHIIHESILKVREFNRIIQENKKQSYLAVDPKQYSETATKYNLNDSNNAKELYEYYFKSVVIGVKRFYEYRQLIKRMYNIDLDDDFRYYSSYVYEMYNNLVDKDDKKCMNALEQFNLSADPNLIRMYDTVMETKKVQQTNYHQQSI